MKTNRWLGAMIVTAWLCGSPVHAQQYNNQPIFPAPSPIAPNGATERSLDPYIPSSSGLSDYIVNRRDCCEGKLGIYTPLYTELYFNVGPSIPVGNATLSQELQTGWSFTGGVRALFFDAPHTRAWVVDAHIINTHQSAGRQNTAFPVNFFHNGQKSNEVFFQNKVGITDFTLQDVNRTLVGLGLGREWYPWQPATSEDSMCRFGLDGGGRWGSQRVNFNEFGHVRDVVGSIYAAIHGDVEIPCRSCTFHAGVRLEWSYIWSDVLQTTSDVQQLSVLLEMGIRF